MKIVQYQVDAFARRVFEGNPAAICPLDAWLPDPLLQAIAEENHLSETAFFVPNGQRFDLRWFTPAAEVDLCGHATLATAHVLFEILHFPASHVVFDTRSGPLTVERRNDALTMDFPARVPTSCPLPETLLQALGRAPVEVLVADDYIAVYEGTDIVRALTPDFIGLMGLDLRGVAVTAAGADVDFTSRFFAPKLGIFEDPVTGSAHCALAPYWARRLGKTVMKARQVSARGGEIDCELKNDRVLLSGRAVTFMKAEIDIGEVNFSVPKAL